jgi:hypothetical protein
MKLQAGGKKYIIIVLVGGTIFIMNGVMMMQK